MGVGGLLKHRQGAEHDVLYECRRCGTSVESEAARCHVCESESIATYEIPSSS